MDDNRQVVEAIRTAFQGGDMRGMNAVLEKYTADEFVEEWPQSGERIRGKDNARRIDEMYPEATGTQPKAKLRRITGSGDTYVVEGAIDYGDGTPVSYVGIAELHDGKVTRLTEYFANPFEPPKWRANLVEHMEPMTV